MLARRCSTRNDVTADMFMPYMLHAPSIVQLASDHQGMPPLSVFASSNHIVMCLMAVHSTTFGNLRACVCTAVCCSAWRW
jgi:hypothetical protein